VRANRLIGLGIIAVAGLLVANHLLRRASPQPAVAASTSPDTVTPLAQPAVTAPVPVPASEIAADTATSGAAASREHQRGSPSPLTPLPAGAVPASDAAAEAHLDLLLHTLLADKVSGNRLAAIDQLRLLGKQGDPGARIQDSLRAATNDPDRVVAVNARDALSDLLD
jgi:hypothetical protein